MNHFIGSQAFVAAPRLAHVITEEKEKNEDTGEHEPTGRMIFAMAKTNHRWPKSLVYRIESIEEPDTESGELIEKPFIVWEGEIGLTANQAIALAEGIKLSESNQKQKECATWLTVKLENGPVRVTEIEREATALRYSRRTLDKAKASVCAPPRFVQPPLGAKPYWVWELIFVPKSGLN